MAVAAIKKIWDYLVGENDDVMDEEMETSDALYDYSEEEEEDTNGETLSLFKRRNKVVSMPQTQQVKMKILKPTTYDPDVNEIISELKSKNGIVMNLEYVNKDVARRIVDFISGAVHALDGHIQKVSNSIFLIAPFNYEIANEMAREEIKNRLSVSWVKK